MDFSGKKVIVTGAASGIGLAQAKAFSAAGAEVIAVDINPDPGEIRQLGLEYYQVDVSDESLVKMLSEEFQEVDILCNTAGILDDYATLDKTSSETWHRIMQTNLDGMFYMISSFVPKMRNKDNSVVLNMASIAGLVAGGGGLAYTTSKHAIVGLTKQLAIDEAKNGIRVLAIAPGAIDTPMNARDFEENNEEMAQKVAEETPLGRWAKAEEVANLSLFLASDQASYMTGSVIPIDGGWVTK